MIALTNEEIIEKTKSSMIELGESEGRAFLDGFKEYLDEAKDEVLDDVKDRLATAGKFKAKSIFEKDVAKKAELLAQVETSKRRAFILLHGEAVVASEETAGLIEAGFARLLKSLVVIGKGIATAYGVPASLLP